MALLLGIPPFWSWIFDILVRVRVRVFIEFCLCKKVQHSLSRNGQRNDNQQVSCTGRRWCIRCEC